MVDVEFQAGDWSDSWGEMQEVETPDLIEDLGPKKRKRSEEKSIFLQYIEEQEAKKGHVSEVDIETETIQLVVSPTSSRKRVVREFFHSLEVFFYGKAVNEHSSQNIANIILMQMGVIPCEASCAQPQDIFEYLEDLYLHHESRDSSFRVVTLYVYDEDGRERLTSKTLRVSPSCTIAQVFFPDHVLQLPEGPNVSIGNVDLQANMDWVQPKSAESLYDIKYYQFSYKFDFSKPIAMWVQNVW